MHRRLAVRVVAAALLLAPAFAQKVGQPAPELSWDKTLNFGKVKDKQLAELKGSAVWLEVIEPLFGIDDQQVRRMQSMHDKLFASGLVVIGLPLLDSEAVDDLVKKRNIRFPIATCNWTGLNVKKLPLGVLIDPTGTVVWRGAPDELDQALLDKTMATARCATLAAGLEELGPLMAKSTAGAVYAKVKELLTSGKLDGPATQQANEIASGHEQRVAEAIDAATKASGGGDFYAAFLQLDPIVKNYGGVPRTDEAAKALAAMQADAKQKREIQGGQKLAEVQALEKSRQFDAAFKAYKAMAQTFGGTRAAKAATDAATAIEKGGKLGYMKGCGACEAAGCACPAHKKKK